MVAERYDEAVFTNPHESFYRQLMRISIVPKVTSQDSKVQASFFEYSDADDFNKLVEAQNFLQKELSVVKERLKLINADMEQVDDALLQVAEIKRAAAVQRSATSVHKTKATTSTGNAAKKAKTNSQQ